MISSPVPGPEREDGRTLEQRVAEKINAAMFWSDSTVDQCAAEVIALVRTEIARDLEATANRYPRGSMGRGCFRDAAAIARGVS